MARRPGVDERGRPAGRTPRAADLLLRLGVGAALAVSAGIHLRLAGDYALAFPGGLGGGTMFRLQAAAALLALVLLVWRGGVQGYVPALAVLAASLAAVVVYRYVAVPALGPVPSMYEPVWYPEKTLAAVAAAAGAVLAGAGAATALRRRPQR